jgi:hypothetical protein
MRGPGPKTLRMIGRRLRAETESVTQERLPEGWLDLIQSLDQREQKQSESRRDNRPGNDGNCAHSKDRGRVSHSDLSGGRTRSR